MPGLIARLPVWPMTSVWPSGGAFAASSSPIVPFAPGRLSGTGCCPKASPSFWATYRPVMSVAAPGGNGMMIRSGLDGYACAASKTGDGEQDGRDRAHNPDACVHTPSSRGP